MTALVAPADAAFARAEIARHSKSFALASRLLGARLRDQTAIVYAWCRRADDAIDVETDRDPALTIAALQSELADVYRDTVRAPVLEAFAGVVRARAIPRHYPDELLAGMAMDATGVRYETVDELLLYCWRVAGVVGLMMSHVFGVADDRALVRAAHLGMAMQLTNICRDVAEDWDRGRLYLPADRLRAHGVHGLVDDLACRRRLSASAVPAIGAVVSELLALAERYYRSGDRGIAALPWRPALAVRTARGIYSAIGGRIEKARFDVTAGRAIVPRGRKGLEVAAAMGAVAWSWPLRACRFLTGRRARVPLSQLEYADVAAP